MNNSILMIQFFLTFIFSPMVSYFTICNKSSCSSKKISKKKSGGSIEIMILNNFYTWNFSRKSIFWRQEIEEILIKCPDFDPQMNVFIDCLGQEYYFGPNLGPKIWIFLPFEAKKLKKNGHASRPKYVLRQLQSKTKTKKKSK